MTTSLRMTVGVIVGLFSLCLINPGMADDELEVDGDAMLYLDDKNPSIDDGSMPIDDMTGDDDDMFADDSDDPSIDDDSASINGLTDGDDVSALIVSDSGVQAQAGGTHVIGNGTSCKNAASKVIFYLNAKGIPLGHTYIKQGGQVGFRNKDARTHTITAKPKSLLAYYSKPITVKGSVYTNAAKTSRKISGTFEDNIPAGSPTSHDVTICP